MDTGGDRIDGGSRRYRRVTLAVGVLAQAALAALQHGLPALSPMLRSGYGLSLPGIGLVLAAANWGIMSTLLLWGALAALLASGVLALSWNGLAMTAAAEMAGHARAGLAIGLQGTVIRVVSAGAGVAFGFVVEQSGSWAVAILLLATLPLISCALMSPLSGEEERRLLPLKVM